MVSLNFLERAINRISRVIALLGLVGMLTLAVATVCDVLARWLFSAPIAGVRDLSQLFTAVIIASCFALCIAEKNNITIRFVGSALPPRGRYSLEAFGNLVTMLVFAAMAWRIWAYANELAVDGETTMVLGWAFSPWWRTVSVLFGICVPVQLVVFLRSLGCAISGKTPKESAQTPTEKAGENA
ncbi:MAG: TRAP transporter small permease [Deltaproteobacteria bacterium]|nr:TRAP transporter small permease [Deltaproteobacteria bacterium]MBW1943813.1 TRAP transporter small permease [Deltaproteobacteria bacterium]